MQGTLQTKIIDGPRPEAEIAQDEGTASNGQGLQRDGEEEWTAHGRWLAAPIATFQFALDPVPAEAMGTFFSSFSLTRDGKEQVLVYSILYLATQSCQSAGTAAVRGAALSRQALPPMCT